jgi:hypothetical protein
LIVQPKVLQQQFSKLILHKNSKLLLVEVLQILLLFYEFTDLLGHNRAEAVEELVELLGSPTVGEGFPADVHLRHRLDDLLYRIELFVASFDEAVHHFLRTVLH